MYLSMLSHSVLPVDKRYRIWPCPESQHPVVMEVATQQQTYKICDAAVPFKLVPRKLARLGASLGVCNPARAPDDGPVEGQYPCSLDELG